MTSAPADETEIQVFNPKPSIYHVHNRCDIAGTCPNAEYLTSILKKDKVATIDDQMITTPAAIDEHVRFVVRHRSAGQLRRS